MKALLTSLFLLSLISPSFSHQDYYILHKIENVYIRIQCGTYTEQINVVSIIGKLSNKLCTSYEFDQPIFLDLKHAYLSPIEPDYFIGYEDFTWEDEKTGSPLKMKGITIRQVSNEFSALGTLPLLEYGIKNLEKIKQEQTKISYRKHYCYWDFYSIEPQLVKLIIAQKTISRPIKDLLAQKTYLFEKNKLDHINYFYRNGAFHFFFKEPSNQEGRVILSVKNLFQIEPITPDTYLIFDSNHSFYSINLRKRRRSKNHHLVGVDPNYKGYEINWLNKTKVQIKIAGPLFDDTLAEKEFIYDWEQDRLIISK